jgi:hypothetical protein
MGKTLAVLLCGSLLALEGCTTVSTMSTAQPDVAIAVGERTYSTLPVTDTFLATTFGNYEFKASKPGQEPLYGLLPMKFNPGYLVLDILFFAPATFFNLREPYPFYMFDLDKRVIRFKRKENEDWREYSPVSAESATAQRYFERLAAGKGGAPSASARPAAAGAAAPSTSSPSGSTPSMNDLNNLIVK